jgi:hypothetical protein
MNKEYGLVIDVNESIWEMACAIQECNIASPQEQGHLVKAWVSMQDNGFCHKFFAEAVRESTYLLFFVNWKRQQGMMIKKMMNLMVS